MMLEDVLKLIKKDRLDEAIDYIEENPIVKVKESYVFRGDVIPWNDPIVLEDRVIYSTCWKEGGKDYGAIYVLDKRSLSLIKKFESEGYCRAVEYANGKIYAGFGKTLYEFDLNLNVLRKIEFDLYISDIKYYDGRLIVSSGIVWSGGRYEGKLYVVYGDFSFKSSKSLPYFLGPIAITDGRIYVGGVKKITENSWRSRIYEFDLNCEVIRESEELEGKVFHIHPFKGKILAGGYIRQYTAWKGGVVSFDRVGTILFDENLRILKLFDDTIICRRNVSPSSVGYHIKTFDNLVLGSGFNFYVFDSKLLEIEPSLKDILLGKSQYDSNELFVYKVEVEDFRFCGFTIDNLRIYAVLDSNWKRKESKLIVLDFLLPLKSRIEKLSNLKGIPLYDQAKSLLLQLKLKEFDELLKRKIVSKPIIRKPVKKPVTVTSIPVKINVKYPSKMRSNTRDIIRIEVIPECDIEGLTLDLSDLSRLFKVYHNGEPVTSIEYPLLRENSKIVEEIEIIPKYKGNLNADIVFRWKKLKKTFPIKINVESVQSAFPIPKYEPIKLIGEGLTSYVYMCRRREDNKIVAVKIPKESEEAGKSFIDELAKWKRLEHLNVVELYDYNIHPYPYAEMELCDCSLAEVKLDPLELATTLAKVLDYAHSKGVIHGDLKPLNILLKDGVIKVGDWGMGITPAYAPSEVLEDSPPDERADIWSYGVILYEHITGENPFQGRDDIETRRKVLEIEPDFSNLGSLKNIVEKCLRKDPNDRFQSFAEIKEELAKISVTVYSSRSSKSRGKDRLRNLIEVIESYELAGDIETAKERIDDGIVIIKDDHSRKILEAMSVLMDIREICLKSIYERKSVDSDIICMKFDNLLSYLDEGIRQAIENDPYAGQIIRYLKTVSTGALGYEELERIYHIACERILHLLKSQ